MNVPGYMMLTSLFRNVLRTDGQENINIFVVVNYMVNYLICKISLYSDNKYITPIINYQLSIANGY